MQQLTWKEAFFASPGPRHPKEFVILFLKGLLMGIADLIPGVSGGTIAFISGIYDPLLDAVGTLNKANFKKLLSWRLKDCLSGVHLRFIMSVGAGILTSIFVFARLMYYLLNQHPVPTWALFFGLIAASIFLVGRHIDNLKSPSSIISLILGATFAYAIVSLIPVDTPDAYWFIYLCGIIGITAMILPGISGSFLLLILGKYEFITAAVKSPFEAGNLVILLVFAAGTFSGLIGFSKFLNYLLKTHRNMTMSFLTGVLVGSMKKVWPWKEVLQSIEIHGKLRVLRDANIWPTHFNTEDYLAFFLAALGLFAALGIEFYNSRKQKISSSL
ncbi:DUF368 domain-containing protein [Candidatus Falkowbacteria bacterium CG10_big_fil_rev_8_21_14_0_10_39_9]|uniref:DUF368 domain-containing protein n=1 Tax=Candidatus Falkowbacteria bacterium CG10_big_fil_rev_8_21_14_0_10_39_9 TaxID=1974566 RepID=A0A2M6WPE4_9BACT|nr:MAG: DUF368 domain-containing protein [Candidatus Falkowbacteria bacterium CG10_big_fil_rev_8_21_14_0_10_39_9]